VLGASPTSTRLCKEVSDVRCQNESGAVPDLLTKNKARSIGYDA